MGDIADRLEPFLEEEKKAHRIPILTKEFSPLNTIGGTNYHTCINHFLLLLRKGYFVRTKSLLIAYPLILDTQFLFDLIFLKG